VGHCLVYREPRAVASPLPVPPELELGSHQTREEWVESGRFSVELLCRTLERGDLSGVDVLDVGCGTKLVKTLLDNSMPIGRYVGIDTQAKVIDWLKSNVSDPRFEFHHLDAHNAMYNPDGSDLAGFEALPVGGRRFDLICLFSVFTHLAPHDYLAMLRLLRRNAGPDTKLLFSLFLRDREREAEFARAIEQRLASPDPEIRKQTEEAVAEGRARLAADGGRRFVDVIPERPLEIARYEPDYAVELAREAGWTVLEVHSPERFPNRPGGRYQAPGPWIQHYMILRLDE
jgi:SAM-dependent methyltransferase